MLSVAALFKANNLGLRVNECSMFIDTPRGVITIPKDGKSDAYRLKDAVTEKTPGGDGMITVHSVNSASKKTANMAEVWAFKKAWDNRKPGNTIYAWGGSFQTRASDHEDNESYAQLDLQSTPHYYNILLTRREYEEFSLVNPGLAYVECEEECLPRMHYHGVHGYYMGAYVDGIPCAPPLNLLRDWNLLPELSLAPPKWFSNKFKKPKTQAAAAPPFEKGAKPDGNPCPAHERAPQPVGGGAQILAEIIDQRRPWSAIEEIYRRPDAANWASLKGFIAPEAARFDVYVRWNKVYETVTAPMFRDEGIPVADVVQRAWDDDPSPMKIMANYLVRKLVHESEGIARKTE